MKNSDFTIERVGLLANPVKPSWRQTVEKARACVESSGRTVVHLPQATTARSFQKESGAIIRETADQSDILIVFGGDGTMLHVARSLHGLPTPLLGINTGGLGFLTAAPVEALEKTLERVWQGELIRDTRPIMQACVYQDATPGPDIPAVNDVVISRGMASRMIELEVIVDGELLTHYRCDGFIISTPTGSTAYSLSAGGAIVSPNAKVFTLTPICPHTLSNRSVIVDMQSVIEVRILSQTLETVLTADGQEQVTLNPDDRIRVCSIPDRIHLLNLPENPFFNILRQKMQWSGSHVVRRSEDSS
ncbi:MAG: NAD(+)/NADH kinase [Verrucomicrobiota bacterium]|nr:NAD(+)/NADH kinase [Verrucomicrobiota bacterium]